MSSNMISSYNKEIIQGFFFLMYYIITRTCSLCPSLIKLILITYFICPHSDLGFFCPLSNGLSFPCILLIHSKNMRPFPFPFFPVFLIQAFFALFGPLFKWIQKYKKSIMSWLWVWGAPLIRKVINGARSGVTWLAS